MYASGKVIPKGTIFKFGPYIIEDTGFSRREGFPLVDPYSGREVGFYMAGMVFANTLKYLSISNIEQITLPDDEEEIL